MKEKHILIATNNKDKYDIVTNIISSVDNNYKFFSLKDIEGLEKNNKEEGNVEKRAFDKANQIYKQLQKNNFEYIIGIDDGIAIKDKLEVNVKEYIDEIVSDKLLKEGEQVDIVRAYCFMKNDGSYETITTKIPFHYKKTTNHVEIKENSYPLSQVLKPVDGEDVVAKMDKEKSNEYYLKFSKKEIQKIFEKEYEER